MIQVSDEVAYTHNLHLPQDFQINHLIPCIYVLLKEPAKNAQNAPTPVQTGPSGSSDANVVSDAINLGTAGGASINAPSTGFKVADNPTPAPAPKPQTPAPQEPPKEEVIHPSMLAPAVPPTVEHKKEVDYEKIEKNSKVG